MIPLSTTICQDQNRKSEHWQNELANSIRKPDELLKLLGLMPDQIPGGISYENDFPLRVPHSYVARMERGNPRDPLLLQTLATQLEMSYQPGFQQDAVGDAAALAVPGLLHKYHGRVLLITTAACPVHCRYCFRRHYPYSDNRPDQNDWSKAMEYIAANQDIDEVILSGGDPLVLTNKRLQEISDQLTQITHIRRLRIHSRMPIVLPERLDDVFCDWLESLPWQTILVTHCNHANEINNQVVATLARLKSVDLTLLNQSVLLKGVNDNAQDLINLNEALFGAGILPYYLHLLDRVIGTGHFEVEETRALSLMHEVQARLPGYMVPKLVRETAGEPYKNQIKPSPSSTLVN
jgi:EF-P beta-lysylation protein EpmB